MHWGMKDTIWGPGLKKVTISAIFNEIEGEPVIFLIKQMEYL